MYTYSTYFNTKRDILRGIAGIPQVTVLSETFENESLKSGSIKSSWDQSHLFHTKKQNIGCVVLP